MKTMKGPRLFLLTAVLATASSTSALADEVAWLTNFEQAKARASKEKKDILIEFAGSDWSPESERLRRRVFRKSVFQTQVPKHFILLSLDNPRDKSKQTAAQKKSHQKLAKKFHISGTPTVLLVDTEGTPYVKIIGYIDTVADAYVADLIAGRKIRRRRDQFLAQASTAKGIKKAKLLHGAIAGIDTNLLLTNYKHLIDEIRRLDADNRAGLKERYEALIRLAEIKSGIGREKPDVTLAKLESLQKEFKLQGRDLQHVLFFQAPLIFRKDRERCKQTLQTAYTLAPDSKEGKQIATMLKKVFGFNVK